MSGDRRNGNADSDVLRRRFLVTRAAAGYYESIGYNTHVSNFARVRGEKYAFLSIAHICI